MSYDPQQLETDVSFLTQQPGWQDPAKRTEFIRSTGVQSRAYLPPEDHAQFMSELWNRADDRGMISKALDWTGTAISEVVKSGPALAAGAAFAVGDALGVTDTGSGTRLERGVTNLVDQTGQTLKQLAPGESMQAKRDAALEALRTDLDAGRVPADFERWAAGEFDSEGKPDAETQQFIDALRGDYARLAVEADQINASQDQEKVRAFMESDRSPTRPDSDIPGVPGPRELLADYLATRDPSSWEAFKNRVTETDQQYRTRLQRWTAEQRSGTAETLAQMPEGLNKEMTQRAFDIQTSPIDLATAALPFLRGAKALQAARTGGVLAQTVRLAAGAGKEALQEGVTEKLQDARATNQQVFEAAAMGAVGGAALETSMAGVGALLRPAGVGQPMSEAPAADGAAMAEDTGDLTAADVADLEPQPPPPPAAAPPRQPILTGVPDRMGRMRETSLNEEPVMEGDVMTDLRIPRSPEALAESQRIENDRLVQEAKLRAQDAKARGMPMIADNPNGSRDILDWANENPIYLPPGFSADRKLPEYEALGRNPLPSYWRQFVASGKQGGNPDTIAQRAYDAGLIADPTADAYVNALQEGIAGRQQYRVQFAERDKALAQEEKRVVDFEKTQGKLAKKPAAQEVTFEDVVPGDRMTIDGEPAVVRNVEYNEDGYLTNVVIEDGKRFGLMQFDPQTRGGLLVDEFKPKSSTPAPATSQAATAPASPTASGTAANQTSGGGTAALAAASAPAAPAASGNLNPQAGRPRAGEAGFVNAEILAEARQFIANGFTTFAQWSQAMVKRFGRSIKAQLERIWEQVKPMAAELLMNYLRRTGGLKELFAGDKAIIPPFMRDSLDTAKTMAAAGKDAETIRAVTGWFPGKYDGKMRWEIPDEGAKVKPALKSLQYGNHPPAQIKSVDYYQQNGRWNVTLVPQNAQRVADLIQLRDVEAAVVRAMVSDEVWRQMQRNQGEDSLAGEQLEIPSKMLRTDYPFEGFNALPLEDVLDHPKLFEAYPEAKDVMVRVNPKLGVGGSFSVMDTGDRVITVGSADQMGTLLHELQHWIQEKEGYAKGSNVKQFGITGTVVNADQIAKLDNQKRALLDRYPDVKAMEQRLQRGEDLTNDEWTRYEQVHSLPEFTANAQARLALVKSPLEQYRSTAGEIEARDVQARQSLTPEQRQAVAPYSSENIATEDAIVLMDAAGPQMSMDIPEGQNVTDSRFASPDAEANVISTRPDTEVLAEAQAWLSQRTPQDALTSLENGSAALAGDAKQRALGLLINQLSLQAMQGSEVQQIVNDTLLNRAGRLWHSEQFSADVARELRQRNVVNNADLLPVAPVLAAKQVLTDRADRVVKERFEGGAEGAVEKITTLDVKASTEASAELTAQMEGEPDAPELGDNPEVTPVNDTRVAELEQQMQELRQQMLRDQTQAENALQETTSTWQKIMGVLKAAGGRRSSLLTGAKGKLADLRKAAMARKAARRAEGRMYANPVGDFADDAIIGASFLAEGLVEFTNWSQALIREIGFRSGQDLRKLYAEASKQYLAALEAEKAAPTRTKGTPKQRQAREKINRAQRTAQNILDSIARRYSDPPIFEEGQRRINAMRELYKERVRTGMPEAEFVKRAMALGANEGTAGILWEASKLEIDAREMMALEKSRAGLAEFLKKDSPALAKLLNALRQKIAPGMTWAQIFMELPAQQKARQREIYRRLMLDERLKALNQAERLQLTNELDKAWQRERRKVFLRELEKITNLGKSKKDKDKVKAALPRLLRLMNLGMLNSETFRGAIAQEYGIKQIDAATGVELRKLAEAIQQAPEGLPRRKLEQQLMQRLQNLTGSTMAEVLESWWTASVLSGWRTQVDIALSLANGLEDVTFGSLVTAVRTGNGRVAKDALFAMLSNLPTAMNEALDHLLTGNRAAMRSYDAEVKAALEDGNKLFGNVGRQLLNKGGMARLPGAFMEFVSRVMTALDHVNSTSTYEGAKAMALARHPELYEQALRITPQDRQAARTQARLELTAGEAPTTRQQRIEEEARMKEILDQRVPLEVQAQAREIGLESALQGEPTGLGWFIYQVANKINTTMRQAEKAYDQNRPDNAAGKAVMGALRLASTLVKVLTGTKFVRTVGHSVNRSLSYAPGIGLMRFAEGNMKGAKADILLAKQLMGTAVGLALLMAFRDGEDDEQGIEGSWRDLTPQQKGQLLAEGKQPYSIWTRDAQGRIRSWNYQQWGIAGVLATIGGMEDQRRYNSQGKDDLAILMDGIVSGSMAWTDKTQLTGLQMLMAKDQAATSSPSGSLASALNKWASTTVGGLVPRIFKDVDMVISPQLRDTSEWWMKWAGQVPMLRELSSGTRVNIFGEDIILDRTPTSRVTQVGTLDPALRTLGRLNERDIWLPDPTQGVRMVKLADGTRRKMTTLEKDRYQRATGAAYRQFITEQGANLLRMDPELARETISKVTERLRAQAAYQALRR